MTHVILDVHKRTRIHAWITMVKFIYSGVTTHTLHNKKASHKTKRGSI